jgi:hypothetical protein
LGLVGLAGGLTLGLGLRPAPIGPPSTPIPSPTATQPIAEAEAAASLRAEVGRLRTAREEDQARFASLAQAQATAQAELASLRRDLASARREPPLAPAPSAQITAVPLLPPRPARAEALPPSGQPRVFIHLRAGSSAAADAAASLVLPLREAGFELGDVRPVTSTPSQRVVRYFHGEDAAAAARLAGRLGRGWAIQDFRSYEPAPAQQTLEIWLPDR